MRLSGESILRSYRQSVLLCALLAVASTQRMVTATELPWLARAGAVADASSVPPTSSVPVMAAAASAAATFNTPEWPTTPDPDTVPASGPPLTNNRSASAAIKNAAKEIKAAKPAGSKRMTADGPDAILRYNQAIPHRNGHQDPLKVLSLRSHHRKQAHRKSHGNGRSSSKATKANASSNTNRSKAFNVQRKNLLAAEGNGSDSGSSSGQPQVLTMSGMLTWYSGKDLLNPACGGPDPTDSSLVGAVSASSSKVGSCGDRVRVTKDGNSVVVTIRDWCASCGPNHMDVTKGVFSQIAPLTVGVLQGVTMVKVADDDDGS